MSGVVDEGTPALSHGAARLTRAVAVAGMTLGTSVACHELVGGMHPSWGRVAALGVAAVPLAYAMSGVRWTLPRLAGVMLVIQVSIHLLCTEMATASTAAMTMPPGVAMPAGMAMNGTAGPITSTGLGLWPMVAAHVMASLICIAALHRGDAALCGLVEALVLRGSRILEAFIPSPAPLRLVAASAGTLVADRLALSDVRRRGPPA